MNARILAIAALILATAISIYLLTGAYLAIAATL